LWRIKKVYESEVTRALKFREETVFSIEVMNTFTNRFD